MSNRDLADPSCLYQSTDVSRLMEGLTGCMEYRSPDSFAHILGFRKRPVPEAVHITGFIGKLAEHSTPAAVQAAEDDLKKNIEGALALQPRPKNILLTILIPNLEDNGVTPVSPAEAHFTSGVIDTEARTITVHTPTYVADTAAPGGKRKWRMPEKVKELLTSIPACEGYAYNEDLTPQMRSGGGPDCGMWAMLNACAFREGRALPAEETVNVAATRTDHAGMLKWLKNNEQGKFVKLSGSGAGRSP